MFPQVGHQCAVLPAVMTVLKREFGVRHEAFASPLNRSYELQAYVGRSTRWGGYWSREAVTRCDTVCMPGAWLCVRLDVQVL